LISPAKAVEKIDKKILQIVEKMKRALLTADKPKGVGLAAPQIGISLRIFVTKPYPDSPIDVFINPQVLWRSKTLGEIKRKNKLEGCLSIPNVWGHLRRSTKVKLAYTDIKNHRREKEFSGFPATIVQHEMDHLEGILFPQRVLEQKEKLYQIEETKSGTEKLVEIEI
ncbi:peptide deformylase, partial [Candidatus Microgenomates bacterium]|nr:peptide deformylase [Candidatus Microgenomates bacterium]